MFNKNLYNSVSDYFTDEFFTREQQEQICDFVYDKFETSYRFINSLDDLTEEEYNEVLDFSEGL